MIIAVGAWSTKWAFDKYIFRAKYQGTDRWETPYNLLNKHIDLKSLSHLSPEYSGATVAPVDMEVEEPMRIHVTFTGDKTSIPDSQRAMLKSIRLHHSESDAGCCVLCRTSGFSHVKSQAKSIGAMYALSKDSKPYTRKQAYWEMVDGQWETFTKEIELPGIWIPCICESKSKGPTI